MKNRKYLILPAILFVYGAVMSHVYRETLTVHHNYLRYFGTIGAELVVIILLTFFLKRRSKLKREREEDLRRIEEEKSASKDDGLS